MNRQNFHSKTTLSGNVLLLLATLLFGLFPASSSSLVGLTVQDTAYRVEEFTVDTPGRLEVETSGGHIEVSGSNTDVIRVEMYVRRNGTLLTPSDSDLDNFDIDISQSGNTVRAVAEGENNSGWSLFRSNQNISISFVVYTPIEMTADLRTSGGHIEVSGLQGNQQLATSGGHLRMLEMSGTVEARTSGGHIEIRNFTGSMDARTSGGHIEVEQVEGDLTLRTSGGHIALNDLSGTVEATTSGGHINAHISRIDGAVDLRTSGGNVNVTVPGETGLTLNLRGNRVRTQLVNFTGTAEDNVIDGTINGGGPLVAARTSGGSVQVNYE